ncbi:MAG: sulfatase [Candidatus Nealsonbacteria bacterium]|nr:sulfatase [Candidatus Nealsonbacteria bacterium]
MRFQRLCIAAIAIILCLLTWLPPAPAAEAKKPNFLFILGDDVTYNDLGCYGGKNVKTPAIDRLAREGMRFNRAYCAMSMCVPFRSELYTGLYPVRNGVAHNHTPAKDGTRSVCHYLRELNYRVGIAGKTHVKPKEVFPFDVIAGKLADEKVAQYMARDPEQPFCLFLCSQNGHPPWRNGDVSKIDRDAIEMPPVIHDNPPTRETFARYLAEVADLDREVGEILDMLEESGQLKNTLVMFSSEQGWDFGFGKWTNWDIGIHTALVARWPGRIKPGATTDALVQMADVVPTLIAAAGGDPAPLKLDGTSFLPVLTGQSDQHRRYVYGLHNNVPEGNPYPIRSIRDDRFHYLINLRHEESYHEKHLMNPAAAKRWDLAWWADMKHAAEQGDATAKRLMEKYHHRPAEELYLVDEDPWELNNLAADPKYAEAKLRLRTELQRWMKQQGDSGIAMDVLQNK